MNADQEKRFYQYLSRMNALGDQIVRVKKDPMQTYDERYYTTEVSALCNELASILEELEP